MTITQVRIYTIPDSQRGAFFDRWDSTARPLMERHGFRFTGTWIGRVDPVQGTSSTLLARVLLAARRPWTPRAARRTFEFVYRLEWDDELQMRKAWATFLADPAWVAAKAASRRSENGEPVLLVSDRVLNGR